MVDYLLGHGVRYGHRLLSVGGQSEHKKQQEKSGDNADDVLHVLPQFVLKNEEA
jgi:hypothetical protein